MLFFLQLLFVNLSSVVIILISEIFRNCHLLRGKYFGVVFLAGLVILLVIFFGAWSESGGLVCGY